MDHEDDEDEEEQDDKRMKPEDIPPPPLGPEYEPETSEAEIEAAIEAKGKAAEALEAEKYSEAVEHLTTALSVMPSALMYARRAEALLKDHRPIAAVHDCDAALKLNPDSAKVLFRFSLPLVLLLGLICTNHCGR